MFVSPAHCLGFLRDAQVHQLHLLLPISLFQLVHAGLFGLKFGIVLDVLKYQQEGSVQVVLSLLLGRTHMQQECCEVGIIKWHHLLCGLISH